MRQVGLVALALAATGCRSLLGFEPAELSDDAPQLCATWTPRGFDPCALDAPAPPLVLAADRSPYHLDTGTGTLLDRDSGAVAMSGQLVDQADGTQLFTLFVEQFTVESGARLDAAGLHPLMIASLGAISIAGIVDAGSHRAAPDLGAGANRTDCVSAAPGAIAGPMGGSGGGGGGGNHGGGGDGGAGRDPGAGGRAATGLGPPAVVRGGCRGADSGAAGSAASLPASNATVSRGGAGGGAIHLAARLSIEVLAAGRVLAGGAGGAGAERGSICGGGGGGAGGYIGFDAESVAMHGVAAANGGGGGGSAPTSSAGLAGEDGGASSARATGGGIGACAAGGGDGAAGVVNVGEAGGTNTTGCGGGGGGGGTGWILLRATTRDFTGGVFSPAAADPT